jgi:hypothetical protein
MARVLFPKPATYRDPRLRELVAKLDCVECGRAGVQAAHLNIGKGMGLKSSDAGMAAVCPACHAEYDQGKSMSRDERRAFGYRAVALTYIALVERGWLTIDKEAA